LKTCFVPVEEAARQKLGAEVHEAAISNSVMGQIVDY